MSKTGAKAEGADSYRDHAEDQNLARIRIPYKEIKIRALLSRSQTREIRLGEYRNQQVVVKRLLKAKRSHLFHVQEFIYQIQIRSTLAHPNIVTLLGVAWNSVADVMLVMEHYPSGDLFSYLQNYSNYTSWERGKYRLAIGIARALVYLHSQPTPVAHRDLRASNVLLTETMRPKLTGFDSSCPDEHSHHCHVAGAPYWSAPEVLRGRPYTAKSDVYAFGVLLTELDTATAPFHDAVSPIGTKLKPIHPERSNAGNIAAELQSGMSSTHSRDRRWMLPARSRSKTNCYSTTSTA
ncbi:protein kinase [Phytophthora infestans T30-4]|uniref:Protein kinase n=1 Tax=Phytophthora infestans (strain T30-4) TaxID=403677 RepID=D0P2Z3_PHYIT|nr:protein kinase [Phytophthora infestans T30-4]EEY58519.1 protein kinase [Phytophthora infestans T30-4]|eukprot:XP_002895331.1 protein kinase [Phytophthora infestans T30-4]